MVAHGRDVQRRTDFSRDGGSDWRGSMVGGPGPPLPPAVSRADRSRGWRFFRRDRDGRRDGFDSRGFALGRRGVLARARLVRKRSRVARGVDRGASSMGR